MQGREEQLIRKEQKLCVVFHHEDFGGQLVWALQRFDIEGPSTTFFEVKQQQTSTGAAGGGIVVAMEEKARRPSPHLSPT